MYKTKIGLFGGTFDPFHYDHLRSAIGASNLVDRLLIIPTGTAPHKTSVGATANQRWLMCEMATVNHPKLEVVRWETDLPEDQLCYTQYTIDLARKKLGPDVELHWVIGADAIAKIETWDGFQKLYDQLHFIVVSRGDLTRDWLYNQIPLAPWDKIQWIDVDTEGISSTQTRDRVKSGLGTYDLACPAVSEYIRKYNLYK